MGNGRKPGLRRIGCRALVALGVLGFGLEVGACSSDAPTEPTKGSSPVVTHNASPSTVFPPGRGATVPWVEQQAEDGTTNATIIGPSRIKWDANHIEAEAIGRKAVRLNNTGDFVSFHTTAKANSIVVRFSIPDAPNGGGINATLGLYVNGTRVKSLPLTSHYSWSYNGGTIGTISVDTPGPQPHTFFDEQRMLLDEIPVGAEVKLQRDAQDTAAFYVIDLVDFEEVPPPLTMPAGFTSVTQFGIQPNDGKDHGNDILNALASTSKLWFPPGDYIANTITGGNVGLDNHGTEVRGAGMWYTNLRGPKFIFFCDGANTKCTYGDLSIFGEAIARDEETQGPQKAFAGPLGNGSLLENLWIEHEVAGIWVGNDPPYQDAPTQNLTVRNVRVRDTYADGINLDNGTFNSTIENSHFRNTGDDAIAMWSVKWTKWVTEKTFERGDSFIPPNAKNAPDQGVEHGNVAKNNSVQMPWRANCFAQYGGYDEHFLDSTCEDVLTYPGAFIDNEFDVYPFGPAVSTFERISLVRAGGPMFLENTSNPWLHGALKLYMREGDVNDILVTDVDIIDPTYAGIEFRGFGTAYVPPGEKYSPEILAAADNAKYTNVTLRNINVTNAGTYGIEIMDGAGRGQVTFDGVSVSGSATAPLLQGNAPASFFNRINSNPGWGDNLGNGGGGTDAGGGGGTDAGGGGGTDGGGGCTAGNIALHKTIVASSNTQNFVPGNADDGDPNTYWESANNAFPQNITVDLGSVQSVNKVILKLPPSSSWGARTQTLSVLGSTDGNNFSTLSGSAGANFDPASGNTATISFNAASARYVRLNFTANTGWPAGQVSELEVYGTCGDAGGGGGNNGGGSGDTVNFALHSSVNASSFTQNLAGTNAVDGDANSYWESANNAFPQSITVDLGSARNVNKVVLKLPPSSSWGARTQTLSVLGSTDGSNFATLVGSGGVNFDPASGNTATIDFGSTSARFVRLNVTANTGWPAAQFSEVEVYGP